MPKSSKCRCKMVTIFFNTFENKQFQIRCRFFFWSCGVRAWLGRASGVLVGIGSAYRRHGKMVRLEPLDWQHSSTWLTLDNDKAIRLKRKLQFSFNKERLWQNMKRLQTRPWKKGIRVCSFNQSVFARMQSWTASTKIIANGSNDVTEIPNME